MPENMSISVNGQSQVPPGFRFHPTEEELLHYYLRKKVSFEKIDLDVIRDVDLNKLEPWDIQVECKVGTTPQNDWYFFSHKDKKYPTGTRTNRATAAGFWKATGRDKVIYSNCKRIGMRKTLVFYKGRAPHGQKSDWIMHEYRLDDNITMDTNVSNNMGEGTQEEGWVVCRIFKKKNHQKTLENPNHHLSSSSETRSHHHHPIYNSCNEGALEQIIEYMGRTCKEENETNNNCTKFLRPIDTSTINNNYIERFTKLPNLESPSSTTSQICYQPIIHPDLETNSVTNWAALDRLVASQLNGQTDTSSQLSCFTEPSMDYFHPSDHHDLRPSTNYSSEIDLWSFSRSSSSSNPLCHVSDSHV